MLVTSRPFEAGLRSGLRGVRNETHSCCGGGCCGAGRGCTPDRGRRRTALGAARRCTLAPQLRDLTINQGLGSYTPLAWGKDTLVRLYMSQPSCAASGALIQVTGATLTVAGGGQQEQNRSRDDTVLVSVYPALATYSTAPAVDSTGDVKFDIPGATLSPAGSEAGFTATFTATINYVQQPNSRTALAPGSVSFTVRPGTTTPITTPVARKTNALRVLVVPMGDPTKLYNTQLTAAGQQEIQRGMLTLARIFPLRDGIATLTDTSAAGLAAGLRYSISPTLLDVSALDERRDLLRQQHQLHDASGLAGAVPAGVELRQSRDTRRPSAGCR